MYEVHAYVTQWFISRLKHTKWTRVISMFNNIFPLHTKTQDYHLEYLMCYSTCRSVFFSFKTVIGVDECNCIGK